MLFDWTAGAAYVGLHQAFVSPQAGEAVSVHPSTFTLVYDPFLFTWVQYTGEPGPQPAVAPNFLLVYDPFLFIWVQVGGESGFSSWQADGTSACVFEVPTSVTGTFEAAGAGSCEFTGPPLPVIWWRCDGQAGGAWTLFYDQSSGFAADGAGTCVFTAAGAAEGGLTMQGEGGATFESIDPEFVGGWNCDGFASCQFYGHEGTGEECLTSQQAAVGRIPNFVY